MYIMTSLNIDIAQIMMTVPLLTLDELHGCLNIIILHSSNSRVNQVEEKQEEENGRRYITFKQFKGESSRREARRGK